MTSYEYESCTFFNTDFINFNRIMCIVDPWIENTNRVPLPACHRQNKHEESLKGRFHVPQAPKYAFGGGGGGEEGTVT